MGSPAPLENNLWPSTLATTREQDIKLNQQSQPISGSQSEQGQGQDIVDRGEGYD